MPEDSSISRHATILLASVLVALAIGAAAAAASPPGARLAIVSLGASGRTALFTVGALGGERADLYVAASRRIPAVDAYSAPSWSPDGTQVTFTALTGQVHLKYASYPRTTLAIVSEEGGKVEPVGGTVGGFDGVFSPDGGRIAFAKARRRWRPNGKGGADEVYSSVSIWLADVGSGTSTRLTPWRNELSQYPSSFSPDGSRLAFTRFVGDKPPEAIEMDFSGTASSVLARNALDPVYSPDGRSIAFLRGPVKTITRRRKSRNGSSVSVGRARLTDLYVRSSNGGGLRRLTNTRRATESAPRWDPSGRRIAFTVFKPLGSEASLLGFGDEIREINADGTCATEILSRRRSVLYAATWQPGPGREAGPISC